jgi:hypothetical protein
MFLLRVPYSTRRCTGNLRDGSHNICLCCESVHMFARSEDRVFWWTFIRVVNLFVLTAQSDCVSGWVGVWVVNTSRCVGLRVAYDRPSVLVIRIRSHIIA